MLSVGGHRSEAKYIREKDALSQLARQTIQPYYAVPFGDMMLAGCFGLLAAWQTVYPDLSEPILKVAAGGRRERKGAVGRRLTALNEVKTMRTRFRILNFPVLC